MKSSKFIIPCLLFAILLLSAGCNKEEKESLSVRLVRKVVYYENDDNGVMHNKSHEYRYDAQNRITEMIFSDENGTGISSFFTYPAENIIVYGSEAYMLNNDGSFVSWSVGDRLIMTFAYADGYLQRREHYTEFGTIPVTNSETYTWENGNITNIKLELIFYTDPPTSYSTTLFYEYSIPNKPSSMDFTHDYVGIPCGWYGKSALNLPSKVTNKGDNFQNVTTYRYETDDKGYPIRIFVQENDGDEE